MPTAIPACAQDATTVAILRNRLLVTTALAPLVLAVLPALLPGPAFAACTGLGNTDHINATGGGPLLCAMS